MIEPFEMKITGKGGEREFYLFIKGNEKTTKLTIKYLQEYLKLIKANKK